MKMQDLSLLYEYNYWATKRVLDASAMLMPEDHGTYHRSEAATILTGYGRSYGGIDFTLFLTATGVKPSP